VTWCPTCPSSSTPSSRTRIRKRIQPGVARSRRRWTLTRLPSLCDVLSSKMPSNHQESPLRSLRRRRARAQISQGTVLRAHTVGLSPGSLSLCARCALSSWERERDRRPLSAVCAARRRGTTSPTTKRHSMTRNLVFSGGLLLWFYSGFPTAARTC